MNVLKPDYFTPEEQAVISRHQSYLGARGGASMSPAKLAAVRANIAIANKRRAAKAKRKAARQARKRNR